MSFLSLPALIGPIIGPPLGGFLITYASWHWIFLINIPIGLIGIVLVMRFVVDVRESERPKLDLVGFLLSAICVASLVTAFEGIGRNEFLWWQLLAMVVGGVLCGWLYVKHSKLVAYPVIDLTLMRIPTFATSVMAGNVCRFAVGSTPFLLALLLQVGFGLSPLSAGLITFAGAAGSLLMKFVTTPVVRRYGYRKVLMYNALLTGLFAMGAAVFTPQTPVWVMILILFLAGFFRSLQFTAINTLSYADIDTRNMSRASSFSAMAQQLGITLGVGLAAVTINISMAISHHTTTEVSDVSAGFIVIGVITATSFFAFRRLSPTAGAQLQFKGKKNTA